MTQGMETRSPQSPAPRGRTRSRMDAVLAVETALMGCLHWATISVLPNVLEFRYTDIFAWGPHLVYFTPFAMWLVSVYSTAEWLLRGVTNKGRALWVVSAAIAFFGFPIYFVGGLTPTPGIHHTIGPWLRRNPSGG